MEKKNDIPVHPNIFLTLSKNECDEIFKSCEKTYLTVSVLNCGEEGTFVLYKMSMDYYVGSKLMQQFGFVQNNDKMNTPKSFYISCGYFVFNISEEDAELISDNEWCKIQLIII